MKKVLRLILLLVLPVLFSVQPAHAQMRGRGAGNNRMRSNDVFNVSLSVADSLSGEGIPFCSVYLKPVKDTIITNFTITDADGAAVISSVTRGDYLLFVEMLGYKSHVRQIYFSARTNLGTVLLQEDVAMLQAASVTAAVSPMEIKGDTLVYNAAAFTIGENDMLKDLVKKMPGMELDDDGNLEVNGMAVTQITVNGRTFFMGDKSAALENLPAKVVDKLKITDKDSDKSKMTGIRNVNSSESKTMDVVLKQEYSKGMFGTLSAAGGASLPSKGQDAMVADEPLLWNLSGMLSMFRDKDQLTLIGRGQNVDAGESTRTRQSSGITTGGQAGANYNTDRIRNMNTDLSIYYTGKSRENASRSSTLDYQPSGEEVNSQRTSESVNGSDALSLGLNISNKNKDGLLFRFEPSFSFTGSNSTSSSSSSSEVDGVERNSSVSNSSSDSKALSTSGNVSLIYSRFAKAGRSLSLSGSYSLGSRKGESHEYSLTSYSTSSLSTERNLRYDSDADNNSASLDLQYVEPLSASLMLRTAVSGNFRNSYQDKDAFNADGSENDYYSTMSRSNSRTGRGSALLQYSFGPYVLQAGASVNADNLHTFSRSQGIESDLGEGEWLLNWAPELVFSGNYLNISYRGQSSQPSHDNMLSALDITNPLRISTGNIYLKPSFSHSFRIGTRRAQGARRRSSGKAMVNANFSANINQGQTVTASWYDADRVRYSVPVNADKPALSLRADISANKSFGRRENWRLMLSANGNFSRSVNYQASGSMPGMDTGSFDYGDFMDAFWGNEDGDRFYSGASGFRESLTRHLSYSPRVNLQFRGDRGFEFSLSNSFSGNHAWYSLDNTANSNTYVYSGALNVMYTTPHQFKLGGLYAYSRYFGYSDSFSKTTNNLNFNVSKDIRAFTFTLQARDLLNSGLTVSHSLSETGVTDSYSLSLGRHVLFGVSWHFGRMGATQAGRASGSSSLMKKSL